VAKAIEGKRDQAFIGVKFGGLRTPQGGFSGIDCRPVAVKNFAAYTLNRLGVEEIDLYMPARRDPAVPYEETIGAVADLIKEGKVRYLGISEVGPEYIKKAAETHPVASLQIEYSLATRFIETEILGLCRELGIGITPYGVISRGLLSGALDTQFAPEDFRGHSPRFQGKNMEKNLARVQVLADIAKEKGCSAAQLSFAWMLAQGKDIMPLIGTTKVHRLEENLKSLDIVLSAEELEMLDKTFPLDAFAGERYAPEQMRIIPS
jgi:aryl-alcohol dehydrogenase-like predicted oxidoreductase